MSEPIAPGCDCPDSAEALGRHIQQQVEQITAWCQMCETPFAAFEKDLFARLRLLGCLFVSLFLLTRHQRLDRKGWLVGHRLVDAWAPRQLKTLFGTIRYARAYLARQRGRGGFHPLDVVLGLTRDRFSPGVISLATRLTTRLSYKTTELVLTAFWGWSPSTEALEHLVLGMGRLAPTYMSSAPPFAEAEGEILVIEVDGKAAPMVRAAEMLKRRGPRRHGQGCACGCQRHRGRQRRRQRGPKKPRKKWARDKNGRSATLVVMYTLRRSADGLLHGPLNKRVWGSFAKRKVMLRWARAEATRRGFPPDTPKRIQVLVDGERCLALGLKKLFPQALLTLDIRHVEEKLWQAGRAFHAEGSTALAAWVKELRTLLYEQGGTALVQALRERLEPVPKHGPGTKQKRQGLGKVIKYVDKRLDLMAYPQRLAEDMPVATGNVEGAVRHVVGQRLDCSGMRWVVGKAEAMLRLRCIEINGQWDDFFAWCQQHWRAKLQRKKPLLIRAEQAIPLLEAA
jgi:hypothetical protein